MSHGVGGSNEQDALARLEDMTSGIAPIPVAELQVRLEKLQQYLVAQGADACYLHAGTNMRYFTGLDWHPSERMVAVLVPAKGSIQYIAPQFEVDTLRDYWQLEATIHTWEEHESPYELARGILQELGASSRRVLIDEATPYFTVHGLQQACLDTTFDSAQAATQSCRSRKSDSELAILQRAHEMTLEVQRAAASILRPGITTTEVEAFIDEAHRRVGATGSSFCIVLFGVATSFPHGVKEPQVLSDDDWVLVDTGCLLHGYNSDITRTYCFGEPNEEQRSAWQHEREAQLAGFEAATMGAACEACDRAAREKLESFGYGPDYAVPGLPHRTGHGCGLDIHESPNLVRGETTPLDVGMVFSCEPMLVVPGKFGVRLEDHFYMSSSGAKWFTTPSPSLDAPFDE